MNKSGNCRQGYQHRHNCQGGGFRHGPSSYYVHDSDLVFEKLALNQGDVFLDLGCGAGDYSIRAASIVGGAGSVYALDVWPEVLNNLCEEARKQGIQNIHPVVSDIRKQIDIPDHKIDVCFICTVLHVMDFSENMDHLVAEVKRVLKPEGRLAVIECQKDNRPFGPPKVIRITPEELEKTFGKHGFLKTEYIDLGADYMMMFALNHEKSGD